MCITVCTTARFLPVCGVFAIRELWIALVVARCGEFPSGTGRRLAAMAGHVSSRTPAMQLRVSPDVRVPSTADRADTGRAAPGNNPPDHHPHPPATPATA